MRSIAKLGDTPFYAYDVEVILDKGSVTDAVSASCAVPIFFLKKFTFKNEDNLTLSASSINAMRRDACTLLERALTENSYEILMAESSQYPIAHKKNAPSLRVRLQKLSQYSETLANAEFVIIPIDEILNTEAFSIPTDKIIIELPALIYPKDEANHCP